MRLITLDPGHFHAALIQREMYPDVSPQVAVYAPLGPDLAEHLNRIARFNLRPENPTAWELDIHAGPDFLERMLRERPGNVVVLSGRNRGKIDRIQASLHAGINVLADKPWIIEPADLPKLESALDNAGANGLVAYDIMTERFEITSILQRELVNDAGTFGVPLAGAEQDPAVHMESVHHLMKTVAGVANLRPPWFFDVQQQGEGLSDVGTHLVDLVQWILFPDQPIDYRADIQLIAAQRWPTVLSKADFQRVTGENRFPACLSAHLQQDQFEYYCNTLVSYTVRGVHTRLNVRWDYEAAAGAGDTHYAVFRGSRSRVEVRQGEEQKYRPELYVAPNRPTEKGEILAALRRKIESLQGQFPGLGVEELGERMVVLIPDRYRVGHEAHFAQVTSRFFHYLRNPGSLPAWEKANMLAKYCVTTKGVELSRRGTGGSAGLSPDRAPRR
ncbi:MAG: oxidoreductase [Acidobacteria bacterium]|nr:oxidoreductase [Acidobacteriota bacterium]